MKIILLKQSLANNNSNNLLIDPALCAAIPGTNSLRKPMSNLLLSTLNRVTSMAYIPSNFNTVDFHKNEVLINEKFMVEYSCIETKSLPEITTDGTARTFRWHGGTQHLATFLYYSSTFPDHGTYD